MPHRAGGVQAERWFYHNIKVVTMPVMLNTMGVNSFNYLLYVLGKLDWQGVVCE